MPSLNHSSQVSPLFGQAYVRRYKGLEYVGVTPPEMESSVGVFTGGAGDELKNHPMRVYLPTGSVLPSVSDTNFLQREHGFPIAHEVFRLLSDEDHELFSSREYLEDRSRQLWYCAQMVRLMARDLLASEETLDDLSVYEIGSNVGLFLSHLHDTGFHDLAGSDLQSGREHSSQGVEICKALGFDVHLFDALTDLRHRDRVFDLIVSSRVLMNDVMPAEAVREIIEESLQRSRVQVHFTLNNRYETLMAPENCSQFDDEVWLRPDTETTIVESILEPSYVVIKKLEGNSA